MWKEKCMLAVGKYRKARKALLALRGEGDWMEDLQELHDKDMSMMYGGVLDNEEVATEAPGE